MNQPAIITREEYIDRMTRAGLFSNGADNAEHDPRVWAHFFEASAALIPSQTEEEISLHLDKYAFCAKLDEWREGVNWALVTPIVDPLLPVAAAEFEADLPALAESFERTGFCAVTDTFGFLDGFGHSMPYTIRLHSPVAEPKENFAAYLESLNSKRRKRYRQVAENFVSPSIRFELTEDPLTDAEIDFAAANLLRRWEDDWAYAIAQTLWSNACARVRPGSVLFMRVHDGETLLFVQTLLKRAGGVYCQSIFKNEDAFFDGIAPYTDFKCVEALCGSNQGFLDPSCRASLDDPPSIGIAKRATVNADKTKPILAIGNNLSENTRAALSAGVPLGDEA